MQTIWMKKTHFSCPYVCFFWHGNTYSMTRSQIARPNPTHFLTLFINKKQYFIVLKKSHNHQVINNLSPQPRQELFHVTVLNITLITPHNYTRLLQTIS